MSGHGLFVVVLALALAFELAAERARRSLLSAARLTIVNRRSSDVAPGLLWERLSDGKRGLGCEAAQLSTAR